MYILSDCYRRRMFGGKSQIGSGRQGSRQRLRGVIKERSSGGKRSKRARRLLMMTTGRTIRNR